MVIEVVITMQLAMTEVEVCSTVDYNTECVSAEKWIIPRIAVHQWVPAGPWSLGSRSSGPLFIPTHYQLLCS